MVRKTSVICLYYAGVISRSGIVADDTDNELREIVKKSVECDRPLEKCIKINHGRSESECS